MNSVQCECRVSVFPKLILNNKINFLDLKDEKKAKLHKNVTHGRHSSWTVSSGRVWRWLWSSCCGTNPLPVCCPRRVAAAGRNASSCPDQRWTGTWRRRTSDADRQRECEWRTEGRVWKTSTGLKLCSNTEWRWIMFKTSDPCSDELKRQKTETLWEYCADDIHKPSFTL